MENSKIIGSMKGVGKEEMQKINEKKQGDT